MWARILVITALFILGGLLIRTLFKKLPLPETLRQSSASITELEKKYRRWDLTGGFMAIVFGFAGGYAGWWLCHRLCAWQAGTFSGVHILVPQAGICLLGALPAAFITAIAGPWLTMKKILGHRFGEFKQYGSLKMGFDVPRLLCYMLIFFSVLTPIGILLPYNTYMVASDKGLKYNTLFGIFEHRYRYSDIRALQKIVDVKSAFKTDILLNIQFNDGNTWKSGNTAEMSNEQALALIEYLSRRSGTSVSVKQINSD
jgi:hypothetical protein